MRVLFMFVLTLFILSCQDKNAFPDELEFAFNYLDENLEAKEIEDFKNETETDAVFNQYRFGMGLFLRNTLLRNHDKSDYLTNYFFSLGVYHIDNMSSIILTSYHRYLNDKEINLDSQIEEYQENNEPTFECRKNQFKKSQKLYRTFEVGDTLNIKMPVSESNSVVDYDCPNVDWIYNAATDLAIAAIIIKKYSTSDKSGTDVYYYFVVKILSKNHLETEIFMNEKNVGDSFRVKLRTAWIIESAVENG